MASPYKIYLTLAIALWIGFILVMITGSNIDLFLMLNSHTGHNWSFLWANLTFLGDTMVALAILLLFIRIRADLVWAGLVTAIIGTLIVNVLKFYIDTPRPPAVLSRYAINIVGPALFRRSFPSGHTVTVFSMTGILLFYFRSFIARLTLVFIAMLIGISRIAVGAHWPTDVLAGAAIGCLCAVTGIFIVTKLRWSKNKSLQIAIGAGLIMLDFYLLFFYDCKYEQAIYLQYALSLVTLIIGIREVILLTKTG